MARPTPLWFLTAFSPLIELAETVEDLVLARSWVREVILLRARWATVGILLVVAVMAPVRSRPLAFGVAFTLLVGNLVLSGLLRQRRASSLTHNVQLFAVALDCLAATGSIVTFTRDLAALAPAAALIVVVPNAVRFRLVGVVSSVGGALFLIASWAALHLFVFDVIEAERVWTLTIGWLAVLGLAAVTFGALVHTGGELGRWEQHLRTVQMEGYRRQRAGLSRREWDLLPLLARSDLRTYDAIGNLLHPPITAKTVSTHVQRIAAKFEVDGGRWIVVQAAQSRGLLPTDTSSERTPTD